MFETKSVDELVSCAGGKKLDPISPIQFTPLNGDAPEEPQLRRTLSGGTFIESQVVKCKNKKKRYGAKLMTNPNDSIMRVFFMLLS